MLSFSGLKLMRKVSLELKHRLITTPILAIPSDSGGYIVYCDTLRIGLGCVLIQHDKIITYASRQLKKHGQN
jgi:hypothetical protein